LVEDRRLPIDSRIRQPSVLDSNPRKCHLNKDPRLQSTRTAAPPLLRRSSRWGSRLGSGYPPEEPEAALSDDPGMGTLWTSIGFTAARNSLGMIEFENFDKQKGKLLLAEAIRRVNTLTGKVQVSGVSRTRGGRGFPKGNQVSQNVNRFISRFRAGAQQSRGAFRTSTVLAIRFEMVTSQRPRTPRVAKRLAAAQQEPQRAQARACQQHSGRFRDHGAR
jgi:hypothetical protein